MYTLPSALQSCAQVTIPKQQQVQAQKMHSLYEMYKNSQTRHCSSAEQLTLQIEVQHGIDIELTDTSVICLSCYKTFSKILKNPLSLDSNLEELILSLEEEIATSQPTTSNGHVSLTQCTLSVAKHLLRNEAILLSDAYDMLTHVYHLPNQLHTNHN